MLNIKHLALNTRFKDKNNGYWLYIGKNNYADYYCDRCHKLKPTYEFLHYETIELLNTDDTGKYDTSAHLGSECVKEFLNSLMVID
jgi:hypothetical protein